MKKAFVSTAVTVLAISGLIQVAHGGELRSPYAGAGLGTSNVGNMAKIFGGYEFMDFKMGRHKVKLAGELSYVDLGSDKVDGLGIEETTLAAMAVARLPISDRLDVFATAGLHRWAADVSYRILGFTFNESRSGTGTAAGGGLEYRVTNHLGLRGEATLYNANEQETAFSVSLIGRF